jgi:uncharacterized protein (DUF2267 family)
MFYYSQPTLRASGRALINVRSTVEDFDHNFAPDTAIPDVASALRRHVDVKNFDRVLVSLPDGAAKFWQPRSQ